MAYSYLKESNIFDEYGKSKSYMSSFTQNFRENERIARNKPLSTIGKGLPKVTDGSTAAAIRKTPRRIIQQLPTGVVKSDGPEWLGIVAGFIYTNIILVNANDQFALIQKCWKIVENSMIYGACPAYAPMIYEGDYFGPGLVLPYVSDLMVQAGKVSDSDSKFIFLRSWWQTCDIEALIAREEGMKKDKVESGWDLAALRKIKDFPTTKSENETPPAEKERSSNAEKGGIELITAFQRGEGAMFYTFHPASQTIVKRKKNKDPRGEIPVSLMYIDIDDANPLGRSVIDLVGPLQNLMDAEMQMYQYNRALMLNPPVQVWGTPTGVKFAPNSIIEHGANPDSKVEPLTIDSTALAQFPNNYGLMKSQLLNLLSSPDTSISSEVGNPGFSKTDAGVKQTQANVSVDDNQVRKMFEAWFERYSETAVNLYFAERSGIEDIQLDDETADKLRKLPRTEDFDPDTFISQDNKIRINFDTTTPRLKFEVDASSSQVKENAEQLQALDGLLERLGNSPVLQGVVPKNKLRQVWNTVVSISGVEKPEELTVSEEEMQQELERQQQELAQQQQMEMEAKQPAPQQDDNISESISYKDAPEDIKRQMEMAAGYQPSQTISPVQQDLDQKQQTINQKPLELAAKEKQQSKDGKPSKSTNGNTANRQTSKTPEPDQDEQSFMQQLREVGLSDEEIMQINEALKGGANPEELTQAIQGAL